VFWEKHLRGVFIFHGASESILFIYLNDTLNHYCKLYFFVVGKSEGQHRKTKMPVSGILSSVRVSRVFSTSQIQEDT